VRARGRGVRGTAGGVGGHTGGHTVGTPHPPRPPAVRPPPRCPSPDAYVLRGCGLARRRVFRRASRSPATGWRRTGTQLPGTGGALWGSTLPHWGTGLRWPRNCMRRTHCVVSSTLLPPAQQVPEIAQPVLAPTAPASRERNWDRGPTGGPHRRTPARLLPLSSPSRPRSDGADCPPRARWRLRER
jgi:hypothetical protein